MGRRGTEIARQAAAMVLRDDAFPTIVGAVREGRIIFGNIRRFVLYLLACNLSEVAAVGIAVLAGMPLPLLPLQILFLNIVTDVFPAFALALGEGDPDVMQRPPRRPDQSIVSRGDWLSIAGHALAITAATLGAMGLSRYWLGASAETANTVAFLTLALAQWWHVFTMPGGDGEEPLLDNSVTRSPYVWLALLVSGALLLAAVAFWPLARVLDLVPLSAPVWLLVLGTSAAPLCLSTLVRLARKDRHRVSATC
jgi:Ca2+-transporting ATPase